MVAGEKQHEVICGDVSQPEPDFDQAWEFLSILKSLSSIDSSIDSSSSAILKPGKLKPLFGEDSGTVTLNLTPSQFLPCEALRSGEITSNRIDGRIL